MRKPFLALPALVFAFAAAAAVPPLQLSRLTDNAATPGSTGSGPAGFRTIDGVLYFRAAAPGLGTELFRSDGTPGGLHLVADLAPGPASSWPVPLGTAGGKLVVSADDGVHGSQIWAVAADGTPARLTADDFDTLPLPYIWRPLGKVAGRLLAFAPTGALWSIDGTAEGTFDLSAATQTGAYDSMECRIDGAVMTARYFPRRGDRLIRTDGTVAGTAMLNGVPDNASQTVAADVFDGRCYFLFSTSSDAFRDGWTLVESDGTASGTRVSASGTSEAPYGLASLDDALYVTAAEAGRLRLLRRARGAPAFLQAAELPGTWSQYTGGAWRVGNRIAFGGPRPLAVGYDRGLYLSDGTQAGTQQVFPVPGASSDDRWYGVAQPAAGGLLLQYPAPSFLDGATGEVRALPRLDPDFFQQGDTVNGVYVSVSTDETGREVWRTDGTAAGTGRLHDVWANSAGSVDPYNPHGVAIGEVVYAATELAPATGNINTVMRTDGTPAGTRRLSPDAHAAGRVTSIAPFGDGIAFAVNESDAGPVDWYRADAALTAATLIWTDRIGVGSEPMLAGGRLVFGCRDPQDWSEFLCSGDPAGSGTVGMIAPVMGVGALAPLGNAAGTAVFFAGGAIWRSDGTLPGTFMISAPPNGPAVNASPGLAFGDKVYFGLCGGGLGCRLMSSDGTAAGTTAIAALPDDSIRAMVSLGDRFVFATASTTSQMTLWRSDGTAAGTQLLLGSSADYYGLQLTAVGGVAHLTAECSGSACDSRYFVTDGTPAGTHAVLLPMAVRLVRGLAAAVGDQALVFSCKRPSTGEELCVIGRDGEEPRLFADVFPGAATSGAAHSFVARSASGAVFLALDDGVNGAELWRLQALPDAIFGNGFEAPHR